MYNELYTNFILYIKDYYMKEGEPLSYQVFIFIVTLL